MNPGGRPGRQLGSAFVDVYLFPVNSENIDIRMGRETVDVALLATGTMSRPATVTPIEVTFGSFIPDPARTPKAVSWTNVAHEDLINPWDVVRMMRTWQKQNDDKNSPKRPVPLKLTIADTKDFSIWIVLTQFDVQTRPREPGDVYFTATCREIGLLPVLRMSSVGKKPATRVDPRPTMIQTASRKGEHLMTVIKRVKGSVNASMLTQVYNINRSVVGPDKTRVLPEGSQIRIPSNLTPGPG